MCVSKPKVPAPTPVVERQEYKNAPSRASLASDSSADRRRLIPGIATSAQGVTTQASTTKRVKAGGDQQINPVLGGSGSSGPSVVETGGGAPSPVRGGQNKAAAASSNQATSFTPGIMPMWMWAGMNASRKRATQAGLGAAN